MRASPHSPRCWQQVTFRAELDPLNTHLSVTAPGGQPVEVTEPAFDGRAPVPDRSPAVWALNLC